MWMTNLGEDDSWDEEMGMHANHKVTDEDGPPEDLGQEDRQDPLVEGNHAWFLGKGIEFLKFV